MKTKKAFAEAMKVIKNIATIESIDDLKGLAIDDVVSNIDAYLNDLKSEAQTHREAKEKAEGVLSELGTSLSLDIESADSVLNHIKNIQSTGEQGQNDLAQRLAKIENQLNNETTLREQAEAKAKQIETEKNAQTIMGKVSSLLEDKKVLPIHRELIAEKLSRGLVLDSDGDITNSDGVLVSDIVNNYVTENKDSGIIANTQSGGSGATPPNGGSTTQVTSVRGNLEAFADKFK